MGAPRLMAPQTAWSLTAFWGAAVAREQLHWVSLPQLLWGTEGTLGCESHPNSLPTFHGGPCTGRVSRMWDLPQYRERADEYGSRRTGNPNYKQIYLGSPLSPLKKSSLNIFNGQSEQLR